MGVCVDPRTNQDMLALRLHWCLFSCLLYLTLGHQSHDLYLGGESVQPRGRSRRLVITSHPEEALNLRTGQTPRLARLTVQSETIPQRQDVPKRNVEPHKQIFLQSEVFSQRNNIPERVIFSPRQIIHVPEREIVSHVEAVPDRQPGAGGHYTNQVASYSLNSSLDDFQKGFY